MEHPGLSLIIPVYNERDNIETCLAAVGQIRGRIQPGFELIVVDDGSDDGSETLLRQAKEKGLIDRLIRHPLRRGYGAAIKTGIPQARFDYLAITDADRTYPDNLLPDFFNKACLEQWDMIVGARTKGVIPSTAARSLARGILTVLANYLTGRKIPDINSGLRVMKKETVRLYVRILPDGFSLTTTITLAMLVNGHGVFFEPIEYYKRVGRSKIRPALDTVNFFLLITRTILCFNPLKIFLPISAFFILTSAAMVLHRTVVGHGLTVATVIFFLCGMQFLGLGLIADLIDRRLR